MYTTRRAIAGLAVAAAVIPMAAFAQTADVQSQIQALLSQIKALQQQLMQLVASSSPSGGIGPNWMMGSTTQPQAEGGTPGQGNNCITINRNLGIGSRGDDVKGLQDMLRQDPENGFNATSTGFFGPLTAQAMARFQMRMGIASSTDGSVGPLTRGFLGQRCGKGAGPSSAGSGVGMMGPRGVSGNITANNGSSITIQSGGNASVTVNVTASTTIMVFNGTSTPPTIGSVSDLVVGKTAVADGPQNPDGSIQALHITVGIMPPPPGMGGDGMPRGMMPTINGPQGGESNGQGGPQNW